MEAENHLTPWHPRHVDSAKRRVLEGVEAALKIIEADPHVRDPTAGRGKVSLPICRLGANLGGLTLRLHRRLREGHESRLEVSVEGAQLANLQRRGRVALAGLGDLSH